MVEQHLDYRALKQSARASLEHSFLRSESLWSAPDAYTTARGGCALPTKGSDTPGAACQTLLRDSDKARQQWELERRFAVFEEAALAN